MRPLPILVLALLLPACGKTEVPTNTTTTAPIDLFVYADLERVPAPTPARFSAPLPPSVEAFRGDWSARPPRTMVEAQLCKGMPAMWEKLGVAAEAAVAQGVLRLEGAGAAEADGKAFEAEAILKLMEELEKSGGVPD